MFQTYELLTLQSDSQIAIEQSIRQLNRAGLQVLRSFDLKVARGAHVGCTCPHHGTDQCDCQLVVLLVYQQDSPPATLVVHGYDRQTQVVLVDTPDQRPNPQLVNSIMQAFSPSKEQRQEAVNFGLEGG